MSVQKNRLRNVPRESATSNGTFRAVEAMMTNGAGKNELARDNVANALRPAGPAIRRLSGPPLATILKQKSDVPGSTLLCGELQSRFPES